MFLKSTKLSYGEDFSNLGLNYYYKEEYEKAIEFHSKALHVDSLVYGRNHHKVSRDFNNLGVAYDDKKEHFKAIECYNQSLNINTLIFGLIHLKIAHDLSNIALAYDDTGQYDKAILTQKKAIESIPTKDGSFPFPENKLFFDRLEDYIRSQGKTHVKNDETEKLETLYLDHLKFIQPYGLVIKDMECRFKLKMSALNISEYQKTKKKKFKKKALDIILDVETIISENEFSNFSSEWMELEWQKSQLAKRKKTD